MAVASDSRRLSQDGVTKHRLHPHLVDLVKRCVSLLWSAAAEILRRVLELPPILSLPPPAGGHTKNCRPESPHISHAATVQCQVLHTPAGDTSVDIIFVHGLYGSLSNTWRQGRWKKKHKVELNSITLKRHSNSNCMCINKSQSNDDHGCSSCKSQITFGELNANDFDEVDDVNEINNDYKDIIDNLNVNNDYHNSSNDINGNCEICTEKHEDEYKYDPKNLNDSNKLSDKMKIKNEDLTHQAVKNKSSFYDNSVKIEENCILSNMDSYKDIIDDILTEKYEVYDSECDIILSNISGTKAECDEICDEKKFFDKFKASETNDANNERTSENAKQTNIFNECECTKEINGQDTKESNAKKVKDRTCEVGCECICPECYSECWPRDWLPVDYPGARIISINYTSDPHLWRPIWLKEHKRLRLHERAQQMTEQLLELGVGDKPIVWVGHSKGGLFIKQIYVEGYEEYARGGPGSLYARSAGFMFYSVPHRGSALADLNVPPIVARSVELLEMGKDCADVVALQRRWLRAASSAPPPVVCSLVETLRTLMAVLWLRIVSVESADAGVGTLFGVNVDHREVCKPSSRRCPLYRQLLRVIDSALAQSRS